MRQPRETDASARRESIWSIDLRRRAAFFLLFLAQMVFYTVLVAMEETERGGHSSARPLIIAIAQGVAPLVILNVATTVTLLQGWDLMLIPIEALRDKFVRPIADGHRAEGRVQGRAQMHREWSDWNRRRLAAEAEGRPFDDPPPPAPDDEPASQIHEN